VTHFDRGSRRALCELRKSAFLLAALAICLASPLACNKSEEATSAVVCSSLTGTAWTPSVTGASNSNHDSNVVITKTVHESSLVLTGANEAYAGREYSVSISVPTTLGAYGSISLVAEPTSLGGAPGVAWPMLTSFVDPNGNEWVNLDSSCASSGFYNGSTWRTSCVPNQPSSFADLGHYDQYQRAFFGYTSVNSFPRCNWAGGSNGNATTPACATQGFLSSGALPTGTYTAKYMLMRNYTGASPYTGAIRVTVIQKKDTTAGGALDVNVILVGNKNIQDSRSTKGKQNLNLLMQAFHDHFNQTNSNIKLGTIRAIEWDCASGGDSYASASVSTLGSMFVAGNSVIPSGSEGKALNIYLVSTISGGSAGLTILGVSGGITGPMLNGRGNSGLVFSSFNKLGTFNPSCNDVAACAAASQEKAFIDMGGTIAHEAGHYLGLNHLSESEGDMHDPVYDTPFCTTIDPLYDFVTAAECAADTTTQPGGSNCSTQCGTYNPTAHNYCAAADKCAFNHLMWWLGKKYSPGQAESGDGNIISPQSSFIINNNPFVQ
jgi:hypothetical protein